MNNKIEIIIEPYLTEIYYGFRVYVIDIEKDEYLDVRDFGTREAAEEFVEELRG